VCQLSHDRDSFADHWQELIGHLAEYSSQLVLLPAMPFCRWHSRARLFGQDVWREVVQAHDEWERRLEQLAPASTLATRPLDFGNARYDEAFLWDPEYGLRSIHSRPLCADEDDDEMSERGRTRSRTREVRRHVETSEEMPELIPIELAGATIGVLMGDELWNLDEARLYGLEGVQILANPRATRTGSVEQWLAAGRQAAKAARAYCLSSNRADESGSFAGQGWIIGPHGEVLALTNGECRFVTMDLDLEACDRLKGAHPRAEPAAAVDLPTGIHGVP